jgi:hypothetical protein
MSDSTWASNIENYYNVSNRLLRGDITADDSIIVPNRILVLRSNVTFERINMFAITRCIYRNKNTLFNFGN